MNTMAMTRLPHAAFVFVRRVTEWITAWKLMTFSKSSVRRSQRSNAGVF